MIINKRYRSSLYLGIVCLGLLVGCVRKMLPVPSEIPIAEYTEAFTPERTALDNGLTLLTVENRELPLVSGTLTIRGGSLLDRRTVETSAMANLMRTAGAGDLSASELDAELQRLAAGIVSGAGQESISVSFSCLASDLDRVFKLFSDVVLHPRFDEDRLSLWRSQSLESIRRRTDEPWTVAGIGFQQLVFGPTPYGAIATSKDVESLSREELIKLHQRAIAPNGAFLAVSGAVDKQRVLGLIAQHFGNWNVTGVSGAAPVARDTTLPKLDFNPKPGIYFIELPLSQASVFIGHQGVGRLTPDYPAIDVFNQLFGSGFFGSRLMKSVRTERGLVYGIFGSVSSGPIRGKAAIAFQTKTNSVNEAIQASIGELLKLRSNLVSDEELKENQSAVSNAFVFKFDSIEEAVQRAVNLEFLGFPSDFDQTYITRIRAVTPEQIQQVALQRWDLDNLVILIVGNPSVWANLHELSNFEPLKGLMIKKLSFNEVVR